MTRCVNCGLPLQPERNQANCPRCGAPVNAFQEVPQQQFEQAGWGNMGGMPQQNPWGQPATPYNQYPQQNQGWQNGSGIPSSGFSGGMSGVQNGMGGSGMLQTPPAPRRPAPPVKKKPSAVLRIAVICFVLSILILGFIGVAAALNASKSNSPTANSGANQTAPTSTAPAASPTASNASASPTTGASPTATGTAYPGQQYITSAQMVASAPSSGSQPQPATSFVVGSNMYVTFNVNPPSSGGAVCAQWYLNGNQVTTYQQAIRAGSTSSYTWATYGSAGPAYVQLYWASDKTCSDQVLAQQVSFTVTAS